MMNKQRGEITVSAALGYATCALVGCIIYGVFLAPKLVWSTEKPDAPDGKEKSIFRVKCPEKSVPVGGYCTVLPPGSGALQNIGVEVGTGKFSCAYMSSMPIPQNVDINALCYDQGNLEKALDYLRGKL